MNELRLHANLRVLLTYLYSFTAQFSILNLIFYNSSSDNCANRRFYSCVGSNVIISIVTTYTGMCMGDFEMCVIVDCEHFCNRLQCHCFVTVRAKAIMLNSEPQDRGDYSFFVTCICNMARERVIIAVGDNRN